MKFKIYGSPSGDDSLWSSNFRAVQIDDGFFTIQLGSVIPLPEDLFTGDDPRYLGITYDTYAEMIPRTQFITAPYSYHTLKADTSDWARGGPGAGAWVDDGSVVRLASSDDHVGIGTATASEKLVVGQDIGFYGGKYIVSGSPWLDDVCGFKMGGNADNHTTLQWNGDGNPFAIHTRQGGIDYNSTLVLNSGKVGVGTDSPGFRLEVKSSGYADGFRVTSSDGSQLFRIRENSGGACETYISDEAGNTGVMLRAAGKSFFTGGNVGFGTTTPADNVLLNVDKTYDLSDPEYVYGIRSEVTNTGVGGQCYAGCFMAHGQSSMGIGAEEIGAAGSKNPRESPASNEGIGLYAFGNTFAGFFSGDVDVNGNLVKTSGAFKIDHPLDPENKFLQHSFVESPDMMNVYNGNIITDASGDAEIVLPDYFESLNKDFRYQLTVIGTFAQAIVAEKIQHGKFTIKTDKPNIEVSWQVTGIRQDPWAEAHRIEVEVVKKADEKGYYIAPELYGFGKDRQIDHVHFEHSSENQDSK